MITKKCALKEVGNDSFGWLLVPISPPSSSANLTLMTFGDIAIGRYVNPSVSIIATTGLFGGAGVFPLVTQSDHNERKRHGPVFSERSIHGSWGYSGNFGMIVLPAAPEPLPTTGMGTASFDGSGGCDVTATININGTTVGPLSPATCSYAVNPDGTGPSVVQYAGAQPPFDEPLTVAFVNKKKKSASAIPTLSSRDIQPNDSSVALCCDHNAGATLF